MFEIDPRIVEKIGLSVAAPIAYPKSAQGGMPAARHDAAPHEPSQSRRLADTHAGGEGRRRSLKLSDSASAPTSGLPLRPSRVGPWIEKPERHDPAFRTLASPLGRSYREAMTLTVTGLLILLVIAGICGAIGRAIAGGTPGGFLVSIAVGFVGALLGTFLANLLHLPELMVITIERHPFPILWSIIGASVFVALIHLLSGRSRLV